MRAPPRESADRSSSDGTFIFGAALVGCLGTFGMHLLLPALPAIGARFAVGAATTQLLVSLALLAIALGSLVVSPLSDRFGRRPVTLAGLWLFVGGSLLGLVAHSIELLIAARVLQAFGGGASMAVVRATLTDRFGPERAASAMAYTAMTILVVPMVAPTLGGLALEGFGWRAPFALATLIGLAVLFWSQRRLGETRTHARAGRPSGTIATYRQLLRTPDYLGYVAYGSFLMSTVYVFITGAPYVAIEVFGLRPATYGLWFVVPAGASFIGFLLAARWSRRLGSRAMMQLGAGLSLVGALALVALAAAGAWLPLALFVPGALVCFANALSAPNSTSSAIVVRPEVAGAASGLLGFSQLVVSAFFTQLVATLANRTPWPLVTTIAACNLLALATLLWLRRRIARGEQRRRDAATLG